MEARITHYSVTNRRTGKVTICKTRAAASRCADRQDNAFGSYICTTKAHWSDEAAA